MGRGPGRPVHTHGPPHGQDVRRRSINSSIIIYSTPHLMGRGPDRPIKFLDDGPRPGPAHQFFR